MEHSPVTSASCTWLADSLEITTPLVQHQGGCQHLGDNSTNPICFGLSASRADGWMLIGRKGLWQIEVNPSEPVKHMGTLPCKTFNSRNFPEISRHLLQFTAPEGSSLQRNQWEGMVASQPHHLGNLILLSGISWICLASLALNIGTFSSIDRKHSWKGL